MVEVTWGYWEKKRQTGLRIVQVSCLHSEMQSENEYRAQKKWQMALAVAGCQRMSRVDALCGAETPSTLANHDTQLCMQHHPASAGSAVLVQVLTWLQSAAARSQPGLCLWQGVKLIRRSDASMLRAGMLRHCRGLECKSLQDVHFDLDGQKYKGSQRGLDGHKD